MDFLNKKKTKQNPKTQTEIKHLLPVNIYVIFMDNVGFCVSLFKSILLSAMTLKVRDI